MLPHELDERRLLLPETTDHSIVLITGSALRHRRFAYRIQKEFGDLVVAWFEVHQPAPEPVISEPEARVREPRTRERSHERQLVAERRLFGAEVQELRRHAVLRPRTVTDPNSNRVVRTLGRLDPYFFLSLGGAVYGPRLLDRVRGIAINQHAGWSPTFRGANTVDWALYHRHLNCVGTTIHITTADIDGGPILRRSGATLTPWDTPEACLARVVALGTELVCETVKDIIKSNEIVVYDQPPNQGGSYLVSQLDSATRRAIHRDFAHGWLKDALRKQKEF